MLTRIISGVILLPVLIFFIITGGKWLQGAVLVLSVLGMFEFYRAFSKKIELVHYIGFVFGIFYMLFIDFIINESNIFNIFVSVFIVVLLCYMVLFHKKTNIENIFVTFFGFFYACFLMSHIFLVREFTYGKFFIWLVFISAFGCDTGAYFTGVFFGKHKLIPELSPKKTIEGSIGGIVTATAISVIYGVCIERSFALNGVNTVLLCTLTGIIGSVLSQFGDLAASAIKRYVDLKDYGNLIPGHGGILDRFDSVLFTAPVVYYVMLFSIKIF